MEAASSWEAAELLGGVPSAAQRAEAHVVGRVSVKCQKFDQGIQGFWDVSWVICGCVFSFFGGTCRSLRR